MTEVLDHTPDTHDDPMPDWNRVFERIDVLKLPDETNERADDIARNFATGTDIEMFGKAIHDVVVPDIESMAADYAVKVGGEKTAEPEERAEIYEQAAEYIKQLDTLRRAEGDSEEFLRRAANVIALSMVGAHTYENGNGRTARVMAELIRHGSNNKADLMVLATERDISQKQQGGFRIYSYVPSWRSKEQGVSIQDTIRAAASVDIPLSQKQTYLERTQDMYTTPYGG